MLHATPRYRRALLTLSLLTWVIPSGTALADRPASKSPSPFSAYSITTRVSFNAQPDQYLPSWATATIGKHTIVERQVVRDATHYRVDVQFLAPALDSGTLTVVLNGRTMTAYDSRTGLAAWDTVTGPAPHPGDILVGMNLQPMLPATPDPAKSLAQYLTTLRREASGSPVYLRTVGHTRMLGRPVDVIDFGPLMGTGPPSCPHGGPRPSSGRGHPVVCRPTGRGTGRARLWVERDRPVLLKETEGSFSGLPAGMMRQHFEYQVTALSFGKVPASALRYSPPVTAPRARTWLQEAVMGGGDMGWFGGWPETWRTGSLYRAPPPRDGSGKSFTVNGVLLRRDSLRPITTTLGVLYYQPQRTGGLPPPQYQGYGAYVYLQERIQIHGLPAALKTGKHLRHGRCDVWTGAYASHLPWLAVARGRVSMLVTTNALRQQDLISYAFKSLC